MEEKKANHNNGEKTPKKTDETLINTFIEITSSSSKSEALFYLESHNFNLDSAVSTFLESSVTVAGENNISDRPESPLSEEEESQSYSPSNSDDSSSPPPPQSLRSKRKSRASSSAAYNLRSSRPRKAARGGGGGGGGRRSGRTHSFVDSGSDSDEPQDYHIGSGMLVQNPSKANDVDAVFNQARQYASGEGPSEHVPSSGSRNFTGTARQLTGEAVSSVPQPPEDVTHTITFWSNGFTVDGGPLRTFNNPENASFLESVRKSECPKELEPVDKSTSVRVNLTRKEENYPVKKKCHAPFQGVGRTLGSSSDAASVESTVTVTLSTAAPAPSVGLVVDQTQPSTSIQIRLADGTRMVSRFNLQHTIRDIRGFIDASRTGGSTSYQLQTVSFPPKELTDLDQTIEQAGLANSVVIQKL